MRAVSASVILVVVLLAAAVGHTQTAQPQLDLQLYPQNVIGYSASTLFSSNFSGTAQCPGVGAASFTYNFTTKVDPVNDVITYKGTNGLAVTEIAHFRGVTTLTYAGTGNKIIQRQDWTRIKENPNGINNTTGVRHYIGLFLEETQQPKGHKGVVTGTTEGVMTLQEPLSFSSGPLAGIATRVDEVDFIGPQPAWNEPFVASDSRICNFLATGVVQPVDPKFINSCVVDGGTSYTYNGVTFNGNIVGCPAVQSSIP